MGAARNMFIRGAGGRFAGSSSGSGAPRVVMSKGKVKPAKPHHSTTVLFGRTIASATTLHYAPLKSGRKRSVTKFTPAIYTDSKTGKHTEVVARYRYRDTGFKQAGWRPKPARSKMSGR